MSSPLATIIEKTEDNKLQWEQISPLKYGGYIVDAEKAVQAFRASIKDKAVLVLVVKKIAILNQELEDYFDTEFIELYDITSLGLRARFDKWNSPQEALEHLLEAVRNGAGANGSALLDDLEDI